MDQFTTMVLIIGLPPAVIEFLALVWARRRVRLLLAFAMFAIPVLIFVWLFATAGRDGDNLARLGLVSLAIILLGGAIVGAVLGGLVILFRYLRRKGAASS